MALVVLLYPGPPTLAPLLKFVAFYDPFLILWGRNAVALIVSVGFGAHQDHTPAYPGAIHFVVSFCIGGQLQKIVFDPLSAFGPIGLFEVHDGLYAFMLSHAVCGAGIDLGEIQGNLCAPEFCHSAQAFLDHCFCHGMAGPRKWIGTSVFMYSVYDIVLEIAVHPGAAIGGFGGDLLCLFRSHTPPPVF